MIVHIEQSVFDGIVRGRLTAVILLAREERKFEPGQRVMLETEEGHQIEVEIEPDGVCRAPLWNIPPYHLARAGFPRRSDFEDQLYEFVYESRDGDLLDINGDLILKRSALDALLVRLLPNHRPVWRWRDVLLFCLPVKYRR